MEDNQHSDIDLSSVVLKFEKRRYDGGSEIELIRHIESCQYKNTAYFASQNATQPMAQQQAPVSVPQNPTQQRNTTLAGSVQQLNQHQSKTGSKSSRRRQVLETLILGPMEIAVGSVGILTSGLAIVTFAQTNNPEMAEQSKVVLKECTQTFFKGFGDTLLGPIKAIKVALSGS